MNWILFALLLAFSPIGWAEQAQDASIGKDVARKGRNSLITDGSVVANGTHSKITNIVIVTIASNLPDFEGCKEAVLRSFKHIFKDENIRLTALPLSKQAFETGDELEQIDKQLQPSHFAILDVTSVNALLGSVRTGNTPEELVLGFVYEVDLTDNSTKKVVWRYKASVNERLSRATALLGKRFLNQLKNDGFVEMAKGDSP